MASIAGVEMGESALSFANYCLLRCVQMLFTHFTAAAVKGHTSHCIASSFNKIYTMDAYRQTFPD
jgi:hypothetical protein